MLPKLFNDFGGDCSSAFGQFCSSRQPPLPSAANNKRNRVSNKTDWRPTFPLVILFIVAFQLNFGAIQPTLTYQTGDVSVDSVTAAVETAAAVNGLNERISLTSIDNNDANSTDVENVRTGSLTDLVDNWTEIDIARQTTATTIANVTNDQIKPMRMWSKPRRHPQSVNDNGRDDDNHSSKNAREFGNPILVGPQSKHRVLKLLMKDSGNEMDVMDEPSGKIRKVVRKKIKLSKDKNENWMKQLLVTNDDKSGDRWRQIYKLAAKSKIVCFHVLPTDQQPQQQSGPQEQFNLIKKCYPLAQILQTYQINHPALSSLDDQQDNDQSYKKWPKLKLENIDADKSNYSPIINPNIMLMRSAVMSAATPEQLFADYPVMSDRSDVGDSPVINSELLDSQSSFNKEEAVQFDIRATESKNLPEELVPNQDGDSQVQPELIQLNGTQSYLNLYEYKQEPEFKGNNQLNESQSEGLSESSSDYFNVFTEQNGNSIQAEDPNKMADREMTEIQAPLSPTNEFIDKFSGVKDLWQVNRRKKQLSQTQSTSLIPPLGGSLTGETGLVDGMLVSRPRIPKLLLPKVNRPAMYSLNGYVPKPSLQRLASFNLQESINNPKTKKSAKDLKKQKRKRKNRKVYQDDAADDIDVSESVSQRRRLQTGGSPNALVPSSDSSPSARTDEKKTGAKNGKSASRNKKQWPTFSSIPKTSFECNNRDGVFADVEAGCQVWHICQNGATHSFLCPNGTIFNAKNGVCDWWYNSRCDG